MTTAQGLQPLSQAEVERVVALFDSVWYQVDPEQHTLRVLNHRDHAQQVAAVLEAAAGEGEVVLRPRGLFVDMEIPADKFPAAMVAVRMSFSDVVAGERMLHKIFCQEHGRARPFAPAPASAYDLRVMREALDRVLGSPSFQPLR